MLEPEEINEKEIMDYYGFHGIIGCLKFYLFFIKNYSFQMVARLSPYPHLTNILQKARGVEIGNHVFIGPDVIIDDNYPKLIKLEDYVSVGSRTMIFAHSNPTCSLELKTKYYPRIVKSTMIKRGAWVAPGCIILAGVTVGENAIVGAGSVVIRDVEPYSIVGGNPAKLIKKLDRDVKLETD